MKKWILVILSLVMMSLTVLSGPTLAQGCTAYYYVDQSGAWDKYPPGVFDSHYHTDGRAGGIQILSPRITGQCETLILIEYKYTNPQLDPQVYKVTPVQDLSVPRSWGTDTSIHDLVSIYKITRLDGKVISEPPAMFVQLAWDVAEGTYGIVPNVDDLYSRLYPVNGDVTMEVANPTEIPTMTLPAHGTVQGIDSRPVSKAEFAVFTQSPEFTNRGFWEDKTPSYPYITFESTEAIAYAADYWEAEAYCRYQGKRIPTIAELQYSADGGMYVEGAEYSSDQLNESIALIHWADRSVDDWSYQSMIAYPLYANFRCIAVMQTLPTAIPAALGPSPNIDVDVVTQNQFASFSGSTDYKDRNFWQGALTGNPYGEVSPIVPDEYYDADYNQADAYCRHVGKQLPTAEQILGSLGGITSLQGSNVLEWTADKSGEFFILINWRDMTIQQWGRPIMVFANTYFRCITG